MSTSFWVPDVFLEVLFEAVSVFFVAAAFFTVVFFVAGFFVTAFASDDLTVFEVFAVDFAAGAFLVAVVAFLVVDFFAAGVDFVVVGRFLAAVDLVVVSVADLRAVDFVDLVARFVGVAVDRLALVAVFVDFAELALERVEAVPLVVCFFVAVF